MTTVIVTIRGPKDFELPLSVLQALRGERDDVIVLKDRYYGVSNPTRWRWRTPTLPNCRRRHLFLEHEHPSGIALCGYVAVAFKKPIQPRKTCSVCENMAYGRLAIRP